MAFDTKGITIEINGDGSGFEKTLRKIKAETQGLDKEMSKVGRAMKSSFNSKGTGIELFIQKQGLLQSKYANLVKQEHAYKQALEATKASYQENLVAFGEYDERTKSAAQNVQYLESELAVLHSRMDAVRESVLTCGTGMITFHQHLGNVATAAGKAYEALKPISLISAGAIAAATAQTIKFEDAWVGVTKTVDGTPQQMEALNAGLKDLALNTASSYETLAGFAELGGQMGVATDSMLTFTKTVAMLGDTTNIAGEEAAQSLAQIANIMVDAGDRTADYYSRFGSTVVDLGNNFATTEADIVQMTQRLATAGRQVGMSTPQVMALATALGSMGIKAAEGGGSMSKLIKQIQQSVSQGGEGLEAFAETAGMSAEQFAKAWRDDAGTAFAKFLEGIGKSGDVTGKLAELGIEEIRMSNATGALAQSTDLYTDALARADSAWESNTAMMAEAEKRYGTTKTALLQALEAIKQAGASLGESFAPALKDVAFMVKDAAKWFSELPKPVKDTVAKMLLLGAAAAPVAKGIEKITSKGQGMIEFLFRGSGAAEKLSKVLGKTNAGMDGTVTSIASLIGPAGLAGTAFVALASAMAGVGFIAGNMLRDNLDKEARAMGGVIQKNAELIDASKEYAQEAKNQANAADQVIQGYESNARYAETLANKIEFLNGKENLSTIQKQQLKAAVEELNAIYPELNISIDENTGHIDGNTESLRENLAQAQKNAKEKALIEASQKQLEAITQQKMAYDSAKESLTFWNQEVKDSTAAWTEASQKYGEISDEAMAAMHTMNLATEEQRRAQEALSACLEEGTISWSDYFNTINQMGGEASTLNQTLITEFQNMVQQASEAGIQIPENIKQGIESGSMAPTEAINYMTSMMNYMDMVAAAGEGGTSVPLSVASGIIANAGSAQEAANMLNNLIQFEQALTQANLAGVEIPADLAAGIASGAVSVDQAIQQLGSGSAQGLNKQGEFAAAGAGNANAYNNAQTQGVKQGSDQAASAGASAFNSGKISNAAGKEGQQASTKYNTGINTMPGKTGTVLSDTASRFGGSSVPGAAGTMGSSATSAFQRNISGIPSAAQTAYNDVKYWIDQIQSLTRQSFTVKVTKEVKTVETKGDRTVRANSPLFHVMSLANPAGLFASASADPVANESNMGYAARNAVNPTTAALQSAIDTQRGVMAGNQMQIANLSRKMDSLMERLTAVDFDGYLSTIAKNTADTQIVMDRRTVGKLVASDVAKANDLDASVRKKLAGG